MNAAVLAPRPSGRAHTTRCSHNLLRRLAAGLRLAKILRNKIRVRHSSPRPPFTLILVNHDEAVNGVLADIEDVETPGDVKLHVQLLGFVYLAIWFKISGLIHL